MCTPASTMTVEVAGMVMFWQISYGLPARVHVTVCPGAGIGGRLQVPAGAFARGRGREDSTPPARSVKAPESNTNAVVRIFRKECLKIIVVFISCLLGKKKAAIGFFARHRAFLGAAQPLRRNNKVGYNEPLCLVCCYPCEGTQARREKEIEYFHAASYNHRFVTTLLLSVQRDPLVLPSRVSAVLP